MRELLGTEEYSMLYKLENALESHNSILHLHLGMDNLF